MGVSVRLSRNARVYLPFWIAIPAYLIIGIVWLGIAVVWAVVWLIVRGCTLAAGRSVARRQAREAQRPEAIAAEQALVNEYQRQREERERQHLAEIDAKLARTHRYRVTKCSIDALKGGEFTLEAEGLDSVHVQLDAASVIHFLSLKVGDIVQVTLKSDKSGFEEFRHLSRANGAKPRSPIDLSAADVERFSARMG